MVRVLRFIVYIIVLQILVLTCHADSSSDWRDSSLSGLAQQNSDCVEIPSFSNFYTSSKVLDITKTDWVATGSKVQAQKLLKFSWRINGVVKKANKYLVLYRFDPRFNIPQVFIQKYDYNIEQYISDFHEFLGGKLVSYQQDYNSSFEDRIRDYHNYFNFVGRDKIAVSNGDVINVTLIDSSDFFVDNGKFKEEIDYPYYPITTIYTATGLPDNAIISVSSQTWCNAINKSKSFAQDQCSDGVFKSTNFYKQDLVGILPILYPDIINSLTSCDPGVNIQDPGVLCYFNDGRGVTINLNGSPIKQSDESFIFSAINRHRFFYKQVTADGFLDFSTNLAFTNDFVNFPQLMDNWGNFSSEDDIIKAINDKQYNVAHKNEHYGRYFFELEIGNGNGNIPPNEVSNIKLEYIISDVKPDASTSGTPIDYNLNTTAPNDGYLWLRVVNPNTDLQGVINVDFSNYTGSVLFSDTLYNKVITPIFNRFNQITEMLYDNLIDNSGVQLIGRALLTLYIMFYFAWFLIGAVEITAQDLVVRLFKVILIVTLLGPNSWKFFSNNLFSWFTEGIGYLFGQVGSEPSSTKNIFAFLDPLVDKYINPRMWQLLAIQLFQIRSGITLFAIFSIYSLVILFKSILQVVIVYVISFIGLAIMIALAPLFLILMLFERSKSIFDNWLSTLFDYMLKPTILLIFFLLIDQIVSVQLSNIVVRACWGDLFDINININLHHLGLPIDFSFQLPFLPYIPFWVSKPAEVSNVPDIFLLNGTLLNLITASLLFYSLSNMISGLISYTTTITASLTNVAPAKQGGAFAGQGDVTNSIISDVSSVTTKPVGDVAGSTWGTIKRKVIDQDYSRAEKESTNKNKPTSYADKIKTNRNEASSSQNNNNSNREE